MCSPEFAFSRWIKKSNSSSKNFRFAAQKKAQVRHIYHSAFLSCVLTKMGLENAPCAFTVSFSNFRKNLFQQSITMLLQKLYLTSVPGFYLVMCSELLLRQAVLFSRIEIIRKQSRLFPKSLDPCENRETEVSSNRPWAINFLQKVLKSILD